VTSSADPGTSTSPKKITRRKVLKQTGVVTAGTTALAGLGTETVRADNVTWYTDGDQVWADDDGRYVAGIEYAGSGPDDSNVNGPLACGLGLGLSVIGGDKSDENWAYTIEDPISDFSSSSTNPSETSVDIVQNYSQDSHDEDLENVMEYARDAMWSLTVPAPNPKNYLDDDSHGDSSYYSDRDGFEVEWPDVGFQKHSGYDICGQDWTGMNGTLFDLTFGANGECEPGTYEFYAEAYGNVYRSPCDGERHMKDPDFEEWLHAYGNFEIELTEC